MPVRLRPEEVVTIKVLAEKGQPKTAIARQLGPTIHESVRMAVRKVFFGKLLPTDVVSHAPHHIHECLVFLFGKGPSHKFRAQCSLPLVKN